MYSGGTVFHQNLLWSSPASWTKQQKIARFVHIFPWPDFQIWPQLDLHRQARIWLYESEASSPLEASYSSDNMRSRVSSKRTKNILGSNRNSICFGCFLVCFMKPFIVCFGLFRFWCFEPLPKQSNKQTCFKTNCS
jgi:hypothetical protein